MRCGRACWRARSLARYDVAASWRLRSTGEPVAFPALRSDQHHPGCLHEQDAQVTIAALGYLAEDGAVSGRDLPRHQPEPGSEIAALGEHFAIADRRHHGARDDWPDGSAPQRLPMKR